VQSLKIGAATRAEIEAHALACYPEECCGLIVERDGEEQVVRATNVQNERHARDPQAFPRTARTAYAMGPEAAPVLLEAEKGTLRLRAFYHSHPDHDAYFSSEDRGAALGAWGEPSYPDTAHIVIAVHRGAIADLKAFCWDERLRDFVEIPLAVQ